MELLDSYMDRSDVNHKDTYNETPLMYVIQYESTKEVVEKFINKGADLKVKNYFNESLYEIC